MNIPKLFLKRKAIILVLHGFFQDGALLYFMLLMVDDSLYWYISEFGVKALLSLCSTDESKIRRDKSLEFPMKQFLKEDLLYKLLSCSFIQFWGKTICLLYYCLCSQKHFATFQRQHL